MLADTRPSGDDTVVEATGEGSPCHSGARLLGAGTRARGGARPPARVVEAVHGGGGGQVGVRAGGRGIQDE